MALSFPRSFLPDSSATGLNEIDIFAGVDRARREAETLLIALDHELQAAKKGYLCAERLTLADIAAVTTLESAGDLIGQDWGRYPRVLTYINRMQRLPGHDEAFHARAVFARAADARRMCAGGAAVIV